MYDNTCKFLIEQFAADFATWLLGEAVPLTELSPSELSLEPIRADALILLQSDSTILHLEFQTQPDPTMPFRMLDYAVRVYRKFPARNLQQTVMYLRRTTSDEVSKTCFDRLRTRHEFDVIRLWEQPVSQFLQFPGLLP